ncbi:ECF transporter S component [Rhabdothermincola salaria]|uniref:ECF transporter S component n=1 Tax=Rhabdothermincola salaria TaxID=2903142 RepID=UPI001E5A7B06|nr:ECF transporter S component [Rhabdothermincola salaria]MCD9623867.1 ECF transporter S component [Rhabdothermincola salaria]
MSAPTATATTIPTTTAPTGHPGRVQAVRLGWRSWTLLVAASLLGLVAFTWPLLTAPSGTAGTAHSADAPWLFVALLPLLLAIVLAELSEGSLDAKAIALLGVLAACGAALRLPSGGVAGFEPVFFLLVPAGRVLGRGFGFVLGALTLFVSALLTGGVGPWLPFQMFGAAWIGFFAGCLPPLRGRAEVAMLAGYAAAASLVYGLILNLWFWPFVTGGDTAISFVTGAGLGENLSRFWAFHLATSLGFDLPRAAFTAGFLVLAGRPLLAALRRASRRAAFGAAVTFAAAPHDPASPDPDPDPDPDPAAGGSGRRSSAGGRPGEPYEP